MDGVNDAKVLGVEICAGTRLQSRGAKLFDLLETFIDFMTIKASSPKQLHVLNGRVQWRSLMDRPLFSCLHHVYSFMQWQPENRMRSVPSHVISEIVHNVSLFPFC